MLIAQGVDFHPLLFYSTFVHEISCLTLTLSLVTLLLSSG
jgi:hypothetical protein